jgi:ubiquinone/menaquinone biosynthesis C-methylase UbiE/CRP-like cAMP-binding protein
MFVRIVEAQSPEQREEVFRFRYRIYSQELAKDLPGLDHERKIYTSKMDANSMILAAVDQRSGEVVGTLRDNCPAEQTFSPELIEDLKLAPMLDQFGADKISYASAFMVDPAYRGKTVASLLFMALYRNLLKTDRLIEICVAELALVNLYHQIGFRSYAPPYRSTRTAGLRVPLAVAFKDRGYLEKVESPLLVLLPQNVDDKGETAQALNTLYPDCQDPAMSPLERRALWASLAHGGTDKPFGIFDGFDDEKADDLLSSFPTITLKPGENLYRKGEHEQGMAVVLSGNLGVTLEDEEEPHFVAVLGAGALCGEMSRLLGTGRTATLIALEETEVLLLPHNLMEKLERKETSAALQVSRNLNRLLGQRLQAMNGHVITVHGSSHHGVIPVRKQAGNALRKATTIQESYAFATLEDPVRELERLEAQARIGWGLELHWIRRAGFQDQSTILDLGSGPGVTSFMLARTFPRSRIIGVEPEDALRQRAEQRAKELGLDEQCTFVKGTGEQIPLDTDSVDYAYARFLVQHLPDPVPVFTEVKRVLRSGGVALVADVDDEGVVMFPEPPGLRDFQSRSAQAQRGLGGDRSVGRKLMAHMHAAGLIDPHTDVAPVTSHDLPRELLADLAFSFKEQTLRRAGIWKETEDREVLQQVMELSENPDGWMLIPIFFCHGLA